MISRGAGSGKFSAMDVPAELLLGDDVEQRSSDAESEASEEKHADVRVDPL